jgi:hypothetical protein
VTSRDINGTISRGVSGEDGSGFIGGVSRGVSGEISVSVTGVTRRVGRPRFQTCDSHVLRRAAKDLRHADTVGGVVARSIVARGGIAVGCVCVVNGRGQCCLVLTRPEVPLRSLSDLGRRREVDPHRAACRDRYARKART